MTLPQTKRVLFVLLSMSVLALGMGAIRFVDIQPPSVDQTLREEGAYTHAAIADFSHTETWGTQRVLTIEAKEVSIQNGKLRFLKTAFSKVAAMEQVRVAFFDQGELMSQIKSDRATMNVSTRDITFEGNVIFKSVDGRKLQCERLNWSRRRSILSTSESYSLRDENGIVRGKGLRTNERLQVVSGSPKASLGGAS